MQNMSFHSQRWENIGTQAINQDHWSFHLYLSQFAFVTQRPYCPGRPKNLCFTTQSLAVKTVGARLSVVKQSFFGLPVKYGRRVTKANGLRFKIMLFWGLQSLLVFNFWASSQDNFIWRLRSSFVVKSWASIQDNFIWGLRSLLVVIPWASIQGNIMLRTSLLQDNFIWGPRSSFVVN